MIEPVKVNSSGGKVPKSTPGHTAAPPPAKNEACVKNRSGIAFQDTFALSRDGENIKHK